MIVFVVSFFRENSFMNCGVKEEQAGKEKEKNVKGDNAIHEGLNKTPVTRC
jgi:hypothetical protein